MTVEVTPTTGFFHGAAEFQKGQKTNLPEGVAKDLEAAGLVTYRKPAAQQEPDASAARQKAEEAPKNKAAPKPANK